MKLYADSADITAYASALSWSDSMAEHTVKLTFSLPKNMGQYNTPYLPECSIIVSVFSFQGQMPLLTKKKRYVII